MPCSAAGRPEIPVDEPRCSWSGHTAWHSHGTPAPCRPASPAMCWWKTAGAGRQRPRWGVWQMCSGGTLRPCSWVSLAHRNSRRQAGTTATLMASPADNPPPNRLPFLFHGSLSGPGVFLQWGPPFPCSLTTWYSSASTALPPDTFKIKFQ